MITIGLTGGIGSGKSTVTQILAELGAPIIDADRVGHEIYTPGSAAHREVAEAFGDGVLAPDGTIDRAKLGAIVFSDPDALKRLTSIVHPKMLVRMRELIAELRDKGERLPIVVEAAVLIEANWLGLCDEVWLVVAGRDQILSRVEKQRGLKPEQTAARIKAQLSDDERRVHATVVIDNSGTVHQLRANIGRLWRAKISRAV